MKTEPFIADYSCFIGFAGMKFDKGWKRKEMSKKQLAQELHRFRGVTVEHGVKELITCQQDIDEIRHRLATYGVTDMGPKNIYLLSDPTWKQVMKCRNHLAKRILRRPDKKFLYIMAFAGHGM